MGHHRISAEPILWYPPSRSQQAGQPLALLRSQRRRSVHQTPDVLLSLAHDIAASRLNAETFNTLTCNPSGRVWLLEV